MSETQAVHDCSVTPCGLCVKRAQFEEEQLQELQAEISDLDAAGIGESTDNAEICETLESFEANLEDAIYSANELIKACRKLIKRAQEAQENMANGNI